MNLTGRDLLKELDLTTAEFDGLVSLAAELKAARKAGRETRRLEGKVIALIFGKTSTRTRVAFEVAAYEQGAQVTVLDAQSSQIGHKESMADTARVLSRMFDAIEYRGDAQETVEELARHADVPVYNGLTDTWHPTQMLADVLTMREHSGGGPLSYAYLGDARSNMGNSLLVTGAMTGADVRIVAPEALWPSPEVRRAAEARAAETGARLTLTEDPAEGVPGAQFVHTDVWVSMGEPADVWAQRVALLRPYRVDAATLALTGRADAKFMHCLPAFHDETTVVGRHVAEEFGLRDGVEVSNEVFESPASIVFDQAENRMHTIKAVLVATLT
ncbi:MAG: ornithine carbamoyltransferase [Candidatus Nanopelagicales bacterium]